MSSTGANVLTSLKNKMQHLREELEKYKDLHDEKCAELEEERAKRNEVCVTLWSWGGGCPLRSVLDPDAGLQ